MVLSRQRGAQPRSIAILIHKAEFAYEWPALSMTRADGAGGHAVQKTAQRVGRFRPVLGERDLPHCSAMSSAGWPPSPAESPFSCTALSTRHRLTWWRVASTGLIHLRGHDVREGSRCRHTVIPRWKPATGPRRVRSRAQRPRTLVFSLVRLYHRGTAERS